MEMARTSRYSSNTLDSPVCLSCKISNVQQLYLISNAQIFWVTSLPLKCSMFSDHHLFQRIAVTKRPVTRVKKRRTIGRKRFLWAGGSPICPFIASCPLSNCRLGKPDLNSHLITVDIRFLTLLIRVLVLDFGLLETPEQGRPGTWVALTYVLE